MSRRDMCKTESGFPPSIILTARFVKPIERSTWIKEQNCPLSDSIYSFANCDILFRCLQQRIAGQPSAIDRERSEPSPLFLPYLLGLSLRQPLRRKSRPACIAPEPRGSKRQPNLTTNIPNWPLLEFYRKYRGVTYKLPSSKGTPIE
jgi:hypothetical protein